MKVYHLVGTVVLFGLVGCAGPEKQGPVKVQQSWKGKSRDQVYQACIQALHASDFIIETASKDSGLITSGWKEFPYKRDRFRTRLNCLVLDTADGGSLSVKGIIQFWDREKSIWQEVLDKKRLEKKLQERLETTLQEFLKEVEQILGPGMGTELKA